MGKTQHNEVLEAAKRQALRTGEEVGQILLHMREAATKAKDTQLRNKIVQAEKYAKRRNRNKRRGRQ